MPPTHHPTQHICPILHFMFFFFSPFAQGFLRPNFHPRPKFPPNCNGKTKNSSTPHTGKKKLTKVEFPLQLVPFSQPVCSLKSLFSPHPTRKSFADQVQFPPVEHLPSLSPEFSRVFPHCQTSQWGSSQHLLRQSSGVVEPHPWKLFLWHNQPTPLTNPPSEIRV